MCIVYTYNKIIYYIKPKLFLLYIYIYMLFLKKKKKKIFNQKFFFRIVFTRNLIIFYYLQVLGLTKLCKI